ncbi:CASP-like protein PIMP1 [Apium graveolens]|uniref:CASP-like protein PIMP1 n=1 Tax=Apium graveolens TaxID=4045 RepID=UPI003D7AF8C6
MAPPPPTPVVAPLIKLVVRVLTFICLLISLIILTTNTASVFINFNEFKLRFQDVKAYRYMLATIVIGIAYTLLQTAFTIYEATRENRIGGSSFLLFDFYGDKFISLLLATGTGAGFGVTVDLKDQFGDVTSSFDKFFNKGYAVSSMLLIAVLFTAVSSIFSSLSLPKRA